VAPRPGRGDWTNFCGLAVGLIPNEGGQLHVGIVYKATDTVRFCDLAWHYLITNKPAGTVDRLHWWNSGLDEFNREIMIDWIRQLANADAAFPYGFNASGEIFDRDTGSPLPLPIGQGLTCATFVIAAHRARGIELLDIETWPNRPEDAVWQAHIIGVLRTHCESRGISADAHLQGLERDVGSIRFRPDEVAAGMYSAFTPLNFENARQLADEIVAHLTT